MTTLAVQEKQKNLDLQLEQAVSRLDEALRASPSEQAQDSAILRFMFTIELSWKLLQIYLTTQSIEANGSKNILRAAARLSLITDPEQWIIFIEARNVIVHTYNKEESLFIFPELPRFLQLAKELLATIKSVPK